jgi:flagella basal body P-ring formation protein FlgA
MMVYASTGILLLSLVTQIPFAAKTPVEAVQRVAKQVTGSMESVAGISEDIFSGLPLPGAGIEFVAWATDRHTDTSTLRVEVAARRYGRMLGQRSFVFARISSDLLVVPQRIIKKGQSITASDLKVAKPRHRNAQEPYASRMDQVVGRVATHALHPDRPIALRHLREEYRVERGDIVVVRAHHGSVRITMKGEAMENGSTGQRIRVANTRTGRVLRARVTSAGICEVE